MIVRRPALWISAGLACLVFAVYGQTLGFGFSGFDDPVYVSANPLIQRGVTWAGLREVVAHGHNALWIPLTSLTYMLGCNLYGTLPAGHHATNVLFHAANAVLLFHVARRLTKRDAASALIAALFAVHPLNVESVAWVSGRKDLVYATFWLLTLAAYARYVHRRTLGAYALVLVCHGLGLASKSSQMTLPLVLLFLDYWPLERAAASCLPAADDVVPPRNPKSKIQNPKSICRVWLALVVEKIPLILLSIPAALSAYVITSLNAGSNSLGVVPLTTRLMNAAVFYRFYVEKLFWPFGLSAHYAYPMSGPGGPRALAALGLLTVLTLCAMGLRRRRPALFVGWFWFLTALAPLCGVARAGTFLMADRYAYVPMIGLIMALCFAVPAIPSGRNAWPIKAAAAACLALLAWRAADQAAYWRNDVALFAHAVAVEPDNADARHLLGSAYVREGRYDEGIAQFNEALERTPFKRTPLMNLGNAYAALGKPEHAAEYFMDVVRNQPEFVPAHLALADLFRKTGRDDISAAHYSTVLALDPANADARDGLAALGNRPPDLIVAHNALGAAYANLRRFDDALRHYDEALRLEPGNAAAHAAAGVALTLAGRPGEALVHFAKALEVRPGDPDLLTNLGMALARNGDLDQAVARVREAIRVNPGHAGAHFNLGWMLEQQKKPSEAIDEYVAALRINPKDADARAALKRLRPEAP